MASTGKNNGTLIKLYYDGTAISHLTSNEFSIEHSLRDASDKDSAGWEYPMEGMRSMTFSAEGWFAENYADAGADEIMADLATTRGTATIRWSSGVAGDKYYEATCLITSFSMNAPLEETQTFSCEFKVQGAPTIGTVST